ncbi:MAG: YjjG family noncanonical pyrimidine nucleotidase [Paludibacteraceae bacterium]|nr:YjjG family noncanonical pyrimidine nucleotidase [Paludibacteraceae bacterium]
MDQHSSKYKAILIDWDQTIGDWEGAEYLSLQDLYNAHHLSEWFPAFEAYLAIYQQHNRELWEQYGLGQVTRTYLHRERFLYPLLQALGLSFAPQKIVELADTMGQEFLDLTNHYFRLLPDAKETVMQLATRYPITVLSNGFSEVQYYKLNESGLKPYIRHFIISEEVGINKPQPEIFEEALRRIGVSKEEAVMIGDSYSSDIAGAKNAGIDQIWVTWGKPHPQEQTATYEVTNLAEVLNLL